MFAPSSIRRIAVVTLPIALGSCVLAPRATRDERLRAEHAGAAWTGPRAVRTLPALPPAPTWRDVLRRALIANGDLEAAYHVWVAALARIDVAAAWPNTNTSLDYEYMFSDENLKAWNRTTLRIGFDPMQNFSFPTKAMASGRQALEEARAAGARFIAAKLALQRRVLTAWWELALLAERRRLAHESRALLDLARDGRTGTVAAGESQATLVETHLAAVRATDDEATLVADVAAARARLNGLLARPPDAPLAVPETMPPPRSAPAGDERLLAAWAGGSPEIEAAQRELAARREAVGRARQEWIPDFNPFAGLTGSVAQVAGVGVSLPTRVTMVRGAIAEARAMEAQAEAAAAQTASDVTASFVAALAAMRDAERRADLWESTVLPAAEQLVADVGAAYETGGVDLATLVDAERTRLDAEEVLAITRATREMRLADVEALGGFDVETVAGRDAEGRS
jgi:cobalt-zinc-cadmium efflux system outer membrane protein